MNELPFLQSSAASSSNFVAQSKNTGETIRGDTGGEDTKKRGRKKQQDSVPMIVENIAENQKRKNIIDDTGGEKTKKGGENQMLKDKSEKQKEMNHQKRSKINKKKN